MVSQPQRGHATQPAAGHLAGLPSVSRRISFTTGNSPTENIVVHALPPGRGTKAPPEHIEVPAGALPKPEETCGYHQVHVFPRQTPGSSLQGRAARQCSSQRAGGLQPGTGMLTRKALSNRNSLENKASITCPSQKEKGQQKDQHCFQTQAGKLSLVRTLDRKPLKTAV